MRELDLSTTAGKDLTSPGTTLGTFAYMSPEQARAEEIDSRTDLFSMGLMLYEMATGSQAFSGPSAALIFDSILNRRPAPLVRLNPEAPGELSRVVDKALEKERRFRYQHASEMRADLERLRRDVSMTSQPVIDVVFQPSGQRLEAVPVAQPGEVPAVKSKKLKRVFLLGFDSGRRRAL